MELETHTTNGLRAYVARPQQPNRAGILVLSHWGGVDAVTQGICQWLAGHGFLALAWDPFWAYPPDLDATERRRLTRGPITDAIARQEQMQWIGYMREELRLEHVGGIGHCMGGRMGLTVGAVDARLECFTAFYPTVRMPVPEYALPVVDLAPEIKCPVQVHYPGKDESTVYGTFVALRSALEKRPNIPTLAHYYPDAEHGFHSHEGAANLAAKALAEPLTLAFFNACLGVRP